MSTNKKKSLLIRFNMETGLSPNRKTTKRKLREMKGMFADDEKFAEMSKSTNPIVYEFYNLKRPSKSGEIAFGTSIVYPGRVGNEYFMTKGHFHKIRNTAEVYYCLRGRGYMLMENAKGDWEVRDLQPGCAVYVPPRYAHRSINTSPTETLITFFAFRADAGHNYATIEKKGFRKLVVERSGKTRIVDNPKWKTR